MQKKRWITTSEMADTPACLRVCLTRTHPLNFKRLFLGLHLDFSTHQLILYMGIVTLFIEVLGIERSEAVIDKKTSLWKYKELEIFHHESNYSQYFFNVGVTIYNNYIIFFLWKLQLWVSLRHKESLT